MQSISNNLADMICLHNIIAYEKQEADGICGNHLSVEAIVSYLGPETICNVTDPQPQRILNATLLGCFKDALWHSRSHYKAVAFNRKHFRHIRLTIRVCPLK